VLVIGEGGARRAPPPDCSLCPRLAAFRSDNRERFPDWHNAPVSSFGDQGARLLIAGLAPGLRGANRTGRPFTGDHAGIILYDMLLKYGFARGRFDARIDDGLELVGCRITNAVRCAPPENKPVGAEINACRTFLVDQLTVPPTPSVILPLGSIAHQSVLRALGMPVARWRFAHGAIHRLPGGQVLMPSYHCSRYNLNTGRLTPAMFDRVFAAVAGEVRGS
jgi:uracil-DNA glycosylase family 4